MTDEELVKAAKEAREAARNIVTGRDRSFFGDYYTIAEIKNGRDGPSASRRLFDLVQEAARRKIDMCRIFGKG